MAVRGTSAIARTAARLVSYGEAKGDALALLAAAKMLAGLPVNLDAADGQAEVLDAEAIVDKAETLAADDQVAGRIAVDIRSVTSPRDMRVTCWLDEICRPNGICEYWLTC